jgi:hypothetical protein
MAGETLVLHTQWGKTWATSSLPVDGDNLSVFPQHSCVGNSGKFIDF